ncbi:putative LRR receptor-like serine/threonine-protein kinase [Senna tora]|uniref:non-specific serine/threonine protein kinase n=1 Tax=Senna tora TaxID=362788 RepID=A0A834T2P1_9FABA|nr:putative LRR receptor-like serine/threonine-protein kinase [Senna tora]
MHDADFISIDCGAKENYMDETSGIWYDTDENYIQTGTNYVTSPDFLFQRNPTIDAQISTLRSFPEGQRNCYTLKPKQPTENNNKNINKYLIRAVFAYGNYDNKNQVPIFDIYLGVNYWATMRVGNASYIQYHDIIISHLPIEEDDNDSNMVQVCLVNTGQGTPFINTLELRPMFSNNSIYSYVSNSSTSLPLYVNGRADVGTQLPPTLVRYKDDVYDRLWNFYNYSNWYPLNTSAEISTGDSAYKVPPQVLQTAVQSLNRSYSISVNWTYGTTYQYLVFLHFAEIEKLPSAHKRIINVTIGDNDSFVQPLDYLKPITLSSNIPNKGYATFTISAAAESDAPPILNAFEIAHLVPQPNSPTHAQDINAMMEIKGTYDVSRISWQGDPCVPTNLAWDGLNCSSDKNPRIISLNLSSSKLTGQITTSFANLKNLELLDLSNNELTGQLPEFLANLPNLKLLNLTGNKLTGIIPKGLREKANLQLSVANNPGLCQTDSCKKHKFVIPLTASIAVLVIIVMVSLIIWRLRKKRLDQSQKTRFLKQKNQAFSYSQILRITNNFETTIGEGGFGKVYLGTLEDGTQVAVKILSSSSRQGYKEFQSEAQLLTIIHHKNLVSLIGYCNEDNVKALIYEYMDNGDLSQLLSEKNPNVLKWNERLQVAVDAAKGLEYLHNGCKTPIIHRDLKPSNILLNKSMLAKIADFGLSKAFQNDIDSHLSTQPAGTPGYIDPEFQRSGILNKKSDIYSFGIILLQLITGHPPIRRFEKISFIVDWVGPKIECGDIEGIVDSRLDAEFGVISAWKAIEIAMSCTASEPTQRPDISFILQELKECLALEMDNVKTYKKASSSSLSYIGHAESITIPSARNLNFGKSARDSGSGPDRSLNDKSLQQIEKEIRVGPKSTCVRKEERKNTYTEVILVVLEPLMLEPQFNPSHAVSIGRHGSPCQSNLEILYVFLMSTMASTSQAAQFQQSESRRNISKTFQGSISTDVLNSCHSCTSLSLYHRRS